MVNVKNQKEEEEEEQKEMEIIQRLGVRRAGARLQLDN